MEKKGGSYQSQNTNCINLFSKESKQKSNKETQPNSSHPFFLKTEKRKHRPPSRGKKKWNPRQ